MKTISLILLRIAQFIVGFIAVYSICMLLLLNEPFKIFKYKETKGKILKTEESKKNKSILYVTYVFEYDGDVFEKRIRIGKEWFFKNTIEHDIVVYYNTFFPSINYIKNLKMYKGYYIGLIWGLIMLTIFILIDLFSNKEKWAERYKKFFKFKSQVQYFV